MSPVLLALAAALVVAPAAPARSRLSALAGLRTTLPALRGVSTVGAAAAGAALGALLGGPLPAVALTLAAMTGQRRWSARQAARARTRDVDNLAAALEVLVAELRVGAHPAAACATAAAEVSGDASRVLAEAAARARLGGRAAEGLRSGRAGLDRELDRVAAAWTVAEDRGIALAELLDAVRADVAGRIAFGRRTQAGLAGARATAAVLAALPLLGIALGQAVGAAPLSLLLGSTAGGVLLVVGTALVCAGLAWTGHITARVALP